ncbi:MAG: MFS transporter [Methanomicrobiales archaeon]
MLYGRMSLPAGHTTADTKKPRFMAFIVFAAIFMAVLDGNVVNIALPTITTYFGVDVTYSQWVVTAYLVTLTSLLLIFGRVSEYVGRGRMFILGFVVFTLGSLACGLAPDLPVLILFRVVQATGAAMLFSISSAIIYQLYPRGEQGKSMGYVGATVAIGSIAGPVLGGFLVDTLGWQYIFLINVPIGAVLIPVAMKYFGSGGPVRKDARMDWTGAVTMVIFMVSLMLALSSLAADLAVTRPVAVYTAIFLASFALFLLTERRVSNPLLDLSIFRVPAFCLPVLATALYFIALFMVNILGPFYFEGVLNLLPSQVGLVFLIIPVIMVVGSPVAGWLYDNHYSPYYAAVGMAVTTGSLLLLAVLSTRMELLLIVLAFIPMTIGMVLFQSPNNTEIMSSLPAEKIGIASSVSATVRNLGMALGVSVASILLSISTSNAGYSGPVLQAGPVILSSAFSLIMVVSAVLTLLAAGVSLLRAGIVKKEA